MIPHPHFGDALLPRIGMVNPFVTEVGVRDMALASKVVHGVATMPRAETQAVAGLHQLSSVTAFSTIGICLSLIVLNFADGGQWLIALAEGF